MSTVSIITSRYTVDVAGTSGNRARLYVNYTEFIGVGVCVCVGVWGGVCMCARAMRRGSTVFWGSRISKAPWIPPLSQQG